MAGRPKNPTPEEMVQSFTGHVPNDEGDFASLEPIPLAKPPRLSKTELTHSVARQMASYVAAGNTIPVAAAAMGIQNHHWRNWGASAKRDQERGMQAGWEERQSKYLAWAAEMQQAKAQCETTLVALIMAHADKDWKAPAWVAERRFPDRWAVKKQVEVAVKKDITHLSTDELLALTEKGED